MLGHKKQYFGSKLNISTLHPHQLFKHPVSQIGKKLQIEQADKIRRLRYANNYIQFMAQNPEALWLWSDEAAFSLCGHVASNTFVKVIY